MRLIDILFAPWIIIPNRLQEIAEVYKTHLRGPKIDLRIFQDEAKAKEAEKSGRRYRLENGVGIIEMDGTISKRMGFFSFLFGGVSTLAVEQDFKAALADPEVSSILFAIDSPGGTVDGTQELANVIYQGRGKKPIVAFTDGMMASAAYWIGAAADKVYISGDTVEIGSIGVVAIHVDYSKAYEMDGIKVTEIVAGKYKRIASRYAPLSEEGKATIQEIVDHVYSAFVDDVAKFRVVSEEEVLTKMADGKIFMGRKAIEAGLADGVSTLESLIDRYGAKTPRTIRAMVGERIQNLRAERGGVQNAV